jgi:hypothetical protein
VPDSVLFIKHEQKLEELDFTQLLGATPGTPIRVLLLVAVLDELNRLKDRGLDSHCRWRAGHAVGYLRDPREPGRLCGTVRVEYIFDPMGHIRLPIVDDEIIDRSVAAQSLTDDNQMSARARYARLNVVKLSKQLGSAPEPQVPKKQRKDPGSLRRD